MRFMPFAFLAGLLVCTTGSKAQFFSMSPETTVCMAGECRSVATLDPTILYDQIMLMLKTNVGKTVTIRPGDNACSDKGVTVPVYIQGNNRNLRLTRAVVTDVQSKPQPPKISLILSYDIKLNSFTPRCQSADSVLDMTNPKYLTLTAASFSCAMTNKETTQVSISFNIDYLDLQKALIGGAYTITFNGSAVGQSNGRALLHFEERTPVTMDKKSIGLRQPYKADLLAKARADVQMQRQQQLMAYQSQMMAYQPQNPVLYDPFLPSVLGNIMMMPQQSFLPPMMYPEMNYTMPVASPEIIYIAQ